MARHFLRLKLRLIGNGLRASWQRRLGLLFGALYGLSFAAVCFFVLALPRLVSKNGHSNRVGAALVALVFDAMFIGWLLIPLLGFGNDETLDPIRLALLPLTRRQLATGLFAASCVGVAPIAMLLGLSGAIVGFAPVGPGAGLVVAALAVQLSLCIVGSRFVTTALSGILRSRKGRDVLGFVGVLFGAVAGLGGQVIGHLGGHLRHPGHRLPAGSGALYWLPSGWAARAVARAGSGDIAAAVLNLVLAAAAVVLLAWLWVNRIEAALTTREAGGKKADNKSGDLFARPLAFLPRNRTGAMAAKEMRYHWREPRRRAGLMVLLGTPVAGLAVLLFGKVSDPAVVLLAAAGGLLIAQQMTTNQFGLDGAALWMNVASGGDPAVDLRGKNLATGVIGLGMVAAATVALAAGTGGWLYAPLALVLGATVLGIATAVGNVVSVLAPVPVPDSPTNLWQNNAGCLPVLVQMLGMAVTGLLLAPVGVAVAVSLATWRPALVPAVLASGAYGYLVWRQGLKVAARRIRGREPELLSIVGRRAEAT